MITRRTFLCALTLGTLGAPLAGEAQQAAKIARIGFLTVDTTANPTCERPSSKDCVTSGTSNNVVIEYRSAEGKLERLSALAAEPVALKVDVIVTGGATPPALAAKQATRTIPIVFASAPDPVADGLVTSLAAGRQCHGVVQSRPGARRQASGTAQAGRFRWSVGSLSSGSQVPSAHARKRTC